MTVAQLMDLLAALPPSTDILISSDAEGNTYSQIDDERVEKTVYFEGGRTEFAYVLMPAYSVEV